MLLKRLFRFSVLASVATLVACSHAQLQNAGAIKPSVAPQPPSRATLVPCPPGYKPLGEPGLCIARKHPEPLLEIELRQREWLTVRSAPFQQVTPGALANAQAEQQKVKKGPKVRGTAGTWEAHGTGPLISDHPDYGSVNDLGLVNLMGRIDSMFYDAANNRLFAAAGTGGIWLSDDLGDTWRSIGEGLPSQIVGAVTWTTANGGTVIAVSGDPTFGGGAYTGFGAFYSNDLGATWHKAAGVPDGALGFAAAVDPTNHGTVYVASMFGLFRSTDGGRTYANVNLPTGECAGVTGGGKCQLANVVTDVIVRAAGGVNGDVRAGTVLAAVGWRGGRRTNSDGTVQSPNNGLYRSETGTPGSFVKLAAPGFTPQNRIGRVEFGETTGPNQDHDYVYAIVQDSAVLNGSLETIDAADVPDPRGGGGTNLNGVYVSADFGATWTVMGDDTTIAKNVATGSALIGTGQALGFEPGVQAWYNMFITPDPTRQTAEGIPTRLAFGLEEVWQNDDELVADAPMNGPTPFKVIGRYFSDSACLLLSLGLPACPTNRDPLTTSRSTTTHPDQQDALWIPDGAGGVTLAVGNDGGFYKAHVAEGQRIHNGLWGDGSQAGFNTLLPYDVAMANDGTVWAGLQDNGHMKIKPDGQQYMTFGGDGTFAEVVPQNSAIAFEATPFAAMRATADGGQTWMDMPPPVSNARFINPFEMDPLNPLHVVTGGNEIVETFVGGDAGGLEIPLITSTDLFAAWTKVFDLGTHSRPGDPNADPTGLNLSSDPLNGMSAIDVYGDAMYVGFCGPCDILNARVPFKRGFATNVGGTSPPRAGTSDGWHIASANGLPNRFITSVAVDPRNTRTVYVTLGGYSRRWAPPGTLQDTLAQVGEGHLFKSTDAGENFVDISGNLPDVPATWVTLRGSQAIVGTDVGVFASDLKGGTNYAYLEGLPVVPVSTMNLKPDNPNILAAATYGRGIWLYRFADLLPGGGTGTVDPGPPPAGIGTTNVAGPYTFEGSQDGWTIESTKNPAVTWRLGAPGAGTSLSSAQVMPYVDQGRTSIISPSINHTGGWLTVGFDTLRDTEPDFDFMYVEYSLDGGLWAGAPWLYDAATNTWSDAVRFDGTNAAFPQFSPVRVAFHAPAGELRVRFRFASDLLISSPPYTGVAIDNVVIKK